MTERVSKWHEPSLSYLLLTNLCACRRLRCPALPIRIGLPPFQHCRKSHLNSSACPVLSPFVDSRLSFVSAHRGRHVLRTSTCRASVSSSPPAHPQRVSPNSSNLLGPHRTVKLKVLRLSVLLCWVVVVIVVVVVALAASFN